MELNLAPRGPEHHNKPRFISSLQEGNGGGWLVVQFRDLERKFPSVPNQTRGDSWISSDNHMILSPKLNLGLHSHLGVGVYSKSPIFFTPPQVGRF